MTIYILHYAKDDLTHACVDAWFAQSYDIVVIDNASPLPYVPLVDIEVIRLRENLHLIPANNEGMKAHPSPWYFCVNNDVFPAAGCLARMLKIFLNDPEIGVAAPGTSDPGAGWLYVIPGDPDRTDRVVPHVDNHAIMFMQDVVDEIGWPTADGHTHRASWYSNKEFCWRVRRAGMKVVAVRSAYVDHRRERGYDQVADEAGQAWLKTYMGERWQEAW